MCLHGPTLDNQLTANSSVARCTKNWLIIATVVAAVTATAVAAAAAASSSF